MNIPIPQLYKALSDEGRLRILRALSMAELSVAELVRILGMPQSTVSRHLKPLREAELLESRRDGTSVLYHRGPALSEELLASLLEKQFDQLPLDAEDRSSVRRVLDQRRAQNRDFFDRMAGSYGSLTEPGGGWQALASALAIGFRDQRIVDVGCGEGALSLLLAPVSKEVIAIDLSPNMLMELGAEAEKRGLADKIRCVEGELEKLPLADSSADAVFLSQVLHHAGTPLAALEEASRLLKPGASLFILDLLSHEQEWVREEYADLWLGFDPADLQDMLRQLGLDILQTESLPGATPELPVLFVHARNPSP